MSGGWIRMPLNSNKKRRCTMIEPVSGADLLAAAVAGAFVVLAGAGYALLFALSRVLDKPAMMPVAYLSYGLLVVSVVVLADSLHLVGYWWTLVFLMLAGYLLAPHGIWHLCVAVHKEEPDEEVA